MSNFDTFRATITKGDKFEIRVTLTDEAGAPLDLAALGLTPVMQLRSDLDSTLPDATMVAAVTPPNIVDFSLGADLTLALSETTYYARVMLQAAAAADDQITKTRYIFVVEQSATRR